MKKYTVKYKGIKIIIREIPYIKRLLLIKGNIIILYINPSLSSKLISKEIHIALKEYRRISKK